ncbi:Small ubiquitin-related modifier 1 [Vanrija pseudolonga]|uniref:Small ubiquitin-related modifier 1 n=1 Tax=Vanrija pseudolonga TaxID=143232 RepID=A0AAF0Y805_9TREE|nr:Small ubiquitin-related modifier 1 [Vanrija pseudolonga]
MPPTRPHAKRETKPAPYVLSAEQRRRPLQRRRLDTTPAGDGEDIKPKVHAAVRGIDFKSGARGDTRTHANHRRARPPATLPARVRVPHEFAITLQGSKGHTAYRIKHHVTPGEAVGSVKGWMCRRFGYDLGSLRLVFDGQVCANDETMASLGVEEGDVLEVYLEQIGG